MIFTKDIFDYKNLPSSVKKQLRLDSLENDKFREKIYNLFSIAKSQNIYKLNDSQIAVAYYRTYTSKDKSDLKTVRQIQAKLRSIIQYDNEYALKHPNEKLQKIERVENEKEWYTVR